MRCILLSLVAAAAHTLADPFSPSPELKVGVACHAFEHLGNIGHQAPAAAASGATVIYAGFGAAGYSGLPAEPEFRKLIGDETEYIRQAKARGIRLAIGYICATSIIGLDRFDAHWTPGQRRLFGSNPADWLQRGRDGSPLPSWYGGDYRPACMNHPGWRAYERFMVRQHIEAGYDGIFFDNPTVHTKGCYCSHCMDRFATFLASSGIAVSNRQPESVRALADAHPRAFAEFRCTVARDFLAHIRAYAKSLRPGMLITCNNSLNSPSVLYSQCRDYGYNLFEFSKSQDLVVIEDMATQPRTTSDGRQIEYGPTYRQVQALIHGRPLVAVTIADGDYHTPPHLVQLAMAEAAAHQASYMAWTTWPEPQRPRMIAATRAQADFLKQHAPLLNDGQPRRDVQLFLPFRRWLDTNRCAASALATELARRRIQFEVLAEDSLDLKHLSRSPALILEDEAVLTRKESQLLRRWQDKGGHLIVAPTPGAIPDPNRLPQPASVIIEGAPAVRAWVYDQPGRTVLHLLNLDVRRVSSFEDVVTPARNVAVRLRVPARKPRWVRIHSADNGGAERQMEFVSRRVDAMSEVEFQVPEVFVSALVEVKL